jgi:hypothetical protein
MMIATARCYVQGVMAVTVHGMDACPCCQQRGHHQRILLVHGHVKGRAVRKQTLSEGVMSG